MKKEKNLKLNAVMNTILTLSSFLFSLVTYPYVSRVLGPTGTGRVLFVHSLLTYFIMFAQLGIPVYGVRACAAVRDDKEALTRTAQELLLINLIMSVLSYVVLFAGILVIPKLRDERTLIIMMSVCIFLSAIGMEWLYMAMENYTFMAIRSVAFKLVALVLMFFVVRSEEHVLRYGIVLTFALYGWNILNLITVSRFISLKPRRDLNLKQHLKPTLTFFMMSAAVTIYTNLDTVMLGFIKGDAETGYYGTAAKIKTALSSLVTSLGSVLLPRASYYVNNGKHEEFRRMSRKALSVVFLIAPPLVLYFILYAQESVLLMSGSEFLPAVLPLRILMPTLLFIGITNILGMQILVPLGKEKAVFYSEAAGALTDLAVNIIMIPRFGSAGAACASLSAEAVVLIVQALALKDSLKDLFLEVPYWKIAIALVVSGAAGVLVHILPIGGNFTMLLVSAVVFFGLYLVLLLLLKVPILTDFAAELRGRLRKH